MCKSYIKYFLFFYLLMHNFLIDLNAHDLLVAGPTGFCDGTGRIAYSLIDQLSDSLDIAYYRSKKNDAYSEYLLFDDPYGLQKKIKFSDSLQNSSVFLYTNSLPELLRDDCYKNVPATTMRLIYSAFESTAIPNECVQIFNTYFDKVIVPDQFLADSYRNSGVIIPVIVMPMGLYLEKFLSIPLKITHKRVHSPFVFSCVGTRYGRKNIKKLIKAFAAVYGNNQNFLLKLQVKPDALDINPQEGFEKYLSKFTEEELENFVEKSIEEESLEDLVKSLSVFNIEICSEILTEDQYVDFIASSDAYVLLSTGEGFSNTPREAMAAGVPIIISDNTAHTTIVKAGYGIAVPCPNEIDAWYEAFFISRVVGKQFDCNQLDVEKALVQMVKEYDLFLNQTEQAREWVKRYRWSALKPQLVELYSALK